jgi:hypothetical protein
VGKLSKRTVDQATPRDADCFIWDEELPGFGLRVFTSGRRSYVVQYRAKGRTRRFTIGVHGVWTPETARREARVLLGRIAQGDNPAEQRELDHRAITVKELCERYMADAEAGLILGKKQRPKKASTIYTDEGRIKRHIVPLLGTRRVKDLTSADVTQFMRDIASGKTKADVKTRRRGRAIVRGGMGTGRRTVGFLGALLTYAREAGIIETNPAHGIRKAADQKRTRRLSEDEYRLLGKLLAKAIALADRIAEAVSLDMAAVGWRPTAQAYLGRVTKGRILAAVREARGARAVERIAGLKKAEMATAAEELLAGTGWVPEPLRTPGQVFAAVEPETEAALEGEAESAAEGGEPAIASAPPAEDTDAAAIPTAAIAAE